MSLEIWETNLQALKKFRPQLAQRLSLISSAGAYSVPLSKSGVPTLVSQSTSGNLKYLNSSYDPIKEARRLIESHSNSGIPNQIFYGMGLGYALLEWNQCAGSRGNAFVFERDPELVRLAMETLNFESVIQNPSVNFYLEISPEQLSVILEDEDLLALVMNGCQKITSPSADSSHSLYYAELESMLNLLIQRKSIDMKTRSGYSKRFFRNTVTNWPHILNSPGIDSLKNTFTGHTAIVVSAGPSLDKNISLLKVAQKNALLLVVGTALKPLLERGIEPDFIFAVDPASSAFNCFKGLVIPKRCHLVFDPGTCPQIVEAFSGAKFSFDSNLELSRWLARINQSKGSLGDMFSVAHTAFFFSHYLGCDPVLLVGQDLCFQKLRLHCSSSYYNTLHSDAITATETVSKNEQRTFGKYKTSVLPTLDIFAKNAVTLNNLESYKNQFTQNSDIPCKNFNASEGGIPIPGIPNHTLRELLCKYCPSPLRRDESELLRSAPINHPSDLKSNMLFVIEKLETLQQTLSKIYSEYFPDMIDTKNKRSEFVHAMESFYVQLLQDETTMRLLQEYAYADFIEWRRATGCVTKDMDEDVQIEKKFERDRIFLPELLSAMEYLNGAIRNMAEQIPETL
ncbi:MAG: hypothetical protein COV66_13935 [Nitrospinae bacterium CG11_big_fil_rev_8_21_14_0_20_45_15]|nr:MAG: hypothetical protein COV66_13935 [Nitrospinae bacterium CG11_big_fil_rev_8_21_14_0_20_45_15]